MTLEAHVLELATKNYAACRMVAVLSQRPI